MITKLTSEVITEAYNLLKMGNYAVIVCDYLGISERTWYDWIKKGKEANVKYDNGETLGEYEVLYMQFLQSVKKAQSEAVVRNVGIIQKAAIETWQAAAWHLERTKSDLYAHKQTHIISGDSDSLNMDLVKEKLAELKSKNKKVEE